MIPGLDKTRCLLFNTLSTMYNRCAYQLLPRSSQCAVRVMNNGKAVQLTLRVCDLRTASSSEPSIPVNKGLNPRRSAAVVVTGGTTTSSVAPTETSNNSSTSLEHAAVASPAANTAAAAVMLQLLAVGPAQAARIYLDVPDSVADWLEHPIEAILHSPVLAIGAAVLALVMFPKLIRTAINYLALPAIVALCAWIAISHPQETASTVYNILEFVKEHPGASSIGVIVAAGVLLGPDLLAGTAVAGVLLLLASQAGLLQLPELPKLPRLPGQQVVEQQLGKGSRTIKERVDRLDDDDGDYYYKGSAHGRQQMLLPSGRYGSVNAGSTDMQQQQQRPPQQQQQQPSMLDLPRNDSSPFAGAAVEAPGLTKQQQQQRQQQQQQREQQREQQQEPVSATAAAVAKKAAAGIPGVAGDTLQALRGLGSKVGAKLQETVEGVMPENEQLQAGVQKVQKAGQGLGVAAKELRSRVQGLSDRVQHSEAVQGLAQRAGAAAADVAGKVQQGLKQGSGILQQQIARQREQLQGSSSSSSAAVGMLQAPGLAQEQQQRQPVVEQENYAVEGATRAVVAEQQSAADGVSDIPLRGREMSSNVLDSILANS